MRGQKMTMSRDFKNVHNILKCHECQKCLKYQKHHYDLGKQGRIHGQYSSWAGAVTQN